MWMKKLEQNNKIFTPIQHFTADRHTVRNVFCELCVQWGGDAGSRQSYQMPYECLIEYIVIEVGE